MEIRNLNTFKVVTEVRGITKAAEILGYAQSSVTAQIQALEEELATPLFDRLGKKIVLTEAGERLLQYAVEILKLHESAKERIKSESKPSGTLTIGAPESLAAFRLPHVISEYRKLFPEVKIVLKPGLCSDIRPLVRSGELDMAFLLEQEAMETDLHVEMLVEEKMALIAPMDHPLTTFDKINMADLKNEVILQTEPGCSYRSLFEKQLQLCGVYPSQDLEFWSIEAIKNCVMCGLGISLLPYYSVSTEIANQKIALLCWDDSPVRVYTQLIYHKAKWMNPAMQEFLKMIRQQAQVWNKKEKQLKNST